ncbi:MAG: FHA domain-containing protein [Thermoanaerobaculia bacterium]
MIRFGEFLFDAEARELRRSTKAVHLSPKAFRLLELLIGNAPKAVSKASLYESLWPSVFVEESNLKSLVSEVRAAIGEGARSPRFLKTVYGFGYAFRFDASASAGRFRVTHLARDFELQPGDNILGRDSEASVVIPMKSISRRHARIFVSGDTVTLEDLGSKNGTWVQGRRIAEPTEINDGDELRLGSVPLVFRAAPTASTETDIAE